MTELRKKRSTLTLEESVINRLAFKSAVHRVLWLYGVPLGITSLLYLVRYEDVLLIQVVLAFALLYVPWSLYVKWREGGREELPIFAMLAFMFWITYGVPLFLEEHVVTLTYDPRHHVTDETVTYALLMPLIGISCIWLGIKTQIGRSIAPRTRLFIDKSAWRLDYVRVVLIVGALLYLYETPLLLLGEGGRQLVGISISTVPLLAFAILLRHVIRGESAFVDKILVVGFLIVQFTTGLGSGMLAGSAALIVVCGSVFLMERRRVPGIAAVGVVVFYLFFQIGKGDFRETFWRQQEAAGQVERVMYWTQSSLTRWSEAITEPSGDSIRTAISPSVARVSLLTQTANVIDMTPEVVPYQYGQTYSYMLVTWIPRFLWPNKPSVNEANQFYQVAYGLSEEQDLDTVSIAVGFMAEGFINFGWIGVAGITFLVGIFFDFYRKTFLTRSSGLLLNGIGVVMLGQLLSVEFQVAQYFGGMTQQIVVALLVLLPVIRIRRVLKPRMLMPLPQPSE